MKLKPNSNHNCGCRTTVVWSLFWKKNCSVSTGYNKTFVRNRETTRQMDPRRTIHDMTTFAAKFVRFLRPNDSSKAAARQTNIELTKFHLDTLVGPLNQMLILPCEGQLPYGFRWTVVIPAAASRTNFNGMKLFGVSAAHALSPHSHEIQCSL